MRKLWKVVLKEPVQFNRREDQQTIFYSPSHPDKVAVTDPTGRRSAESIATHSITLEAEEHNGRIGDIHVSFVPTSIDLPTFEAREKSRQYVCIPAHMVRFYEWEPDTKVDPAPSPKIRQEPKVSPEAKPDVRQARPPI